LSGFEGFNEMPIYEYQCRSCGHELEKIQRMSDAPLTDCPDCGDAELQRLVSAAGFRLKGAGWYETDFKKDGKRNLHDSHAADKSSAKSSTKPESSASGESGKAANAKKSADKPAATNSGAA